MSEIILSFPEKNLDTKFLRLKSRIMELTRYTSLSTETKKKLENFYYKFKIKWMSTNRTKDRFFKDSHLWLETKVTFSRNISRGNRGRKRLNFEESSERTKRQKTEELRQNFSPSQLTYAAQMSYRNEKQPSASRLLKVINQEPAKAKDFFKALHKNNNNYSRLTGVDAVSLMVEAKLSKFQYKLIRKLALSNNCYLYPSYDQVLEAKKKCYPNDIVVNEIQAEVPLQELLNHTCQRLLEVQSEVLTHIDLSNNNILKLTLFCKWGFDGSSGQSEYKQRFNNESNSDSSIFFTSIVPIRLSLRQISKPDDVIIWQNLRPSSARFCRPIKLQFCKETKELTNREKANMDSQINTLVPFSTKLGDINIEVSYDIFLTMIDVKVGNALTDNNSTQKCFVCGATSKQFNDIEKVSLRSVINKDYLKLGLSTLHAWIRFFECLLHLAYKQCIKKWQARSAEEKTKVADAKKRIQLQLHSRLGLIVDKPKPGFGSSNDGNTARRFMENAAVVAEICQINIRLLHRFHVILQTLSSGYDIDSEKFHHYAIETAKLFSSLYPWYPMPTSVHRVLLHGSQIISSFILPIGQLSEEAQEARNKDIKNYRLNFARKTSRIDNLHDIFNRLLVSSDPLISCKRPLPPKRNKSLSSEAITLLKCPNINYDIENLNILATESSDED